MKSCCIFSFTDRCHDILNNLAEHHDRTIVDYCWVGITKVSDTDDRATPRACTIIIGIRLGM